MYLGIIEGIKTISNFCQLFSVCKDFCLLLTGSFSHKAICAACMKLSPQRVTQTWFMHYLYDMQRIIFGHTRKDTFDLEAGHKKCASKAQTKTEDTRALDPLSWKPRRSRRLPRSQRSPSLIFFAEITTSGEWGWEIWHPVVRGRQGYSPVKRTFKSKFQIEFVYRELGTGKNTLKICKIPHLRSERHLEYVWLIFGSELGYLTPVTYNLRNVFG